MRIEREKVERERERGKIAKGDEEMPRNVEQFVAREVKNALPIANYNSQLNCFTRA